MKYALASLSAALVAGCATAGPDTETTQDIACFESGERDALLALDFKAFDRTRDQGWRVVASRDCYTEAAQLIADYRAQASDPDISAALRFHQVQMHAAAEEREAAVALLDELIAAREVAEPSTTLHYQRAMRAFLANDLDTLTTARNDLAAMPVSKGFAEGVARYKAQYPDFPVPRWPPNLDVVEAFIACFGETYDEAYGGDACRDAGEKAAYGE